MRKHLKLLLTVLLVGVLMYGGDAGKCRAEAKILEPRDECTYEFDEATGILTVSGEGIAYGTSEWETYKSLVKEIIIKEGITEIGVNVFGGCESLEKIEIPTTVTEIKNLAFSDCSKLTSIKLQKGLQTIGSGAFEYCEKLETIDIPETVTEIGDVAFFGCSNATSINLKEGLKTIGINAFNGCKKLENIKIPTTVTEIGNFAFSNCSKLTSIKLQKGLQTIGSGAFEYCEKLKNIDIPETVTEIRDNAFLGCSDATSIKLQKGLQTIGNRAFDSCKKLENIDIPETVTEIGSHAFYDCNNTTSINLSEGLKTIGSGAFYDCWSLENIDIPETVTEIGDYAFYDCSNATSINLKEGLKTIGNSAFLGCESLENIDIPETVTEIGGDAFSGCKNSKEITISGRVTEIRDYAFSGCNNATSVNLPEGLETIGNSAFLGCEKLKNIDIPETVTEIGDYAFSGCSNATSINLPEGLKTIGNSAFWGCEKLENIGIPTTVTEIGIDAFFNHSASVIELPDSLEDIGEHAFDAYWGNIALIVCSNDKQKSYCREQGYCCVEKSSMPVDLSAKGKITLSLEDNMYTGEPQEPYEMWVTCEDPSGQTEEKTFLRKDKDYTVEYEPNNIDAGMVTIRVKGKGSYKGELTSKFPIYKDLTSKDITCELEYTSASYTGKQIKPKVTVKDKGRVLVEGTDYEVSYKNNINPGQATVTIKGKPLEGRRYGIYQEEITAHYTIHGISIKPAKITLDETIFTYDGSGKKPHVTVTLQGKTLKEGVDYVVSYRNNIVAGTAYAEIHGTGLYEGDISTSYTILPGGSGSPAVYDKDDTLISGNLIYTITDDEDLEVEVAGVSNKKLKRLVIPSTIKAEGKKYKVTSVGHKAFYKNSKLVSVVIGNNVESIEDNAFYGCKNVKSIKMGKSVEIIGTSAFRKCTKLASIVLPKSIDKLGKNAFYGCKKLKSITINANSVIDISANAVKGISKKAVIKVPKKLLKKYRKKLKAKTGFKKTMKIKKK